MSEDNLAQEVGPTAVSLFNLYLQRRNRRHRLEIRAKYKYRTGDPDAPPGGDAS